MIAFCAEYVDSSLGMGYGTILTPLLILLGFGPLEIVPAVLLSEFVTGIFAGFTHHKAGNVDFNLKSTNILFIFRKISEFGYRASFTKGVSLALRIALLLGFCSVAGAVAAVFLALRLSKFWLVFYIGCLIFVIGIVIFCTRHKKYDFSWKRVGIIGLIASFNKGISAGGYGPLVTGGQILSGVKIKSAVGITSLAEALTCLVAVIIYFLKVPFYQLEFRILPYLLIGAVLSVPFAALSIKAVNENKIKVLIGIVTVILGVLTIVKSFSL